MKKYYIDYTFRESAKFYDTTKEFIVMANNEEEAFKQVVKPFQFSDGEVVRLERFNNISFFYEGKSIATIKRIDDENGNVLYR